MGKFLYSLGLIALGLILGQGLRLLVNRKVLKESVPVERYIRVVQDFVLIILAPFINIMAFWIVKMSDVKLISIPFLGIGALALGGAVALAGAKILGLSRKKTGAIFVSGSFTNIGTFGGLICFVFLGEVSFAFVSMYKLFEEFLYYTIGFPIAKLYGSSDKGGPGKRNIIKLMSDPYILASLSSIVIGMSLNFSGIQRPGALGAVNAVLIPVMSVLLVTTVGFKMRFSAVNKYLRECLVVSSIKFVIVPVVITSAAYLIGLGNIQGGLALKVVLILSAMPPAFNSLIPPQIYGLDVDLANSSWLFNTGALVIVLPVLYMIQSIL